MPTYINVCPPHDERALERFEPCSRASGFGHLFFFVNSGASLSLALPVNKITHDQKLDLLTARNQRALRFCIAGRPRNSPRVFIGWRTFHVKHFSHCGVLASESGLGTAVWTTFELASFLPARAISGSRANTIDYFHVGSATGSR